MSGLQHSFVHGLRFLQQPEFRTTSGHYRRLPTEPPSSPLSSGTVCVLQCLALVGQPRRMLAPVSDGASVQAVLQALLPAFTVRVQAPEAPLGSMALTALRNGGAALVRMATTGPSHWALVAGVEWTRSAQGTDALALLLLDPTAPLVWATGYNARLEAPDGNPKGYRYTTTDGTVRTVRIAECVTVQRPWARAPMA